MVLVLLLIAAASPPSSSTVYIMRHCARSTYLPDLYGGQRPAYLANYSDGGDLPDWGVAPTLCTARGRRIIQGQGRSLRGEILGRMGPAPGRLKVTYDAGSTRDNTTAEDLLAGLGLPSIARVGDAAVFDPPWCPQLTAAAKERAVRARLKAVPRPARYEGRLAALQALLGRGVAPPLQSIPDVVAGGAVGWLGGSFVASSWVEAMLLQFGAGLPMAYGRVAPPQLYEMLELHVYYRAIADRGLSIERRGESNLLAHVLRDLASGAGGASPQGGGASLYVGHDTNLDGLSALLGLGWPAAPPYPANTTVPGGMLRLTATAAGGATAVCASFLYTRFEDASGGMAEVDALFPTGKPCISLVQLTQLAAAVVDKRCVRLPAPSAS